MVIIINNNPLTISIHPVKNIYCLLFVLDLFFFRIDSTTKKKWIVVLLKKKKNITTPQRRLLGTRLYISSKSFFE